MRDGCHIHEPDRLARMRRHHCRLAWQKRGLLDLRARVRQRRSSTLRSGNDLPHGAVPDSDLNPCSPGTLSVVRPACDCKPRIRGYSTAHKLHRGRPLCAPDSPRCQHIARTTGRMSFRSKLGHHVRKNSSHQTALGKP